MIQSNRSVDFTKMHRRIGCCLLFVVLFFSCNHQITASSIILAAANDGNDPNGCLNDPTRPECATYRYPIASASADLEQLCNAMSWMPGCTLRRICQSNPTQLEQKSRFCSPISLLGDICALDMPMTGCQSYMKLCKSNGTKVEQCSQEAPLSSSLSTRKVGELVRSVCADHTMEPCGKCDFSRPGSRACPDPLQVYSDMCLAMPEMSACESWSVMCKDLSADGFPLCPQENSREQPPLMRMYFHNGWKDYILFKDWVPTTAWEYWLSCFAIFMIAFVYEFLITARAIMEYKWATSLRQSIYAQSNDDDGNNDNSGGEIKRPNTTMEEDRVSISSRGGLLASSRKLPVQPFRGWVDTTRGVMAAIEITISYALMLIAMTFNIGLYFSVVAGVGVGTFVFARYRPLPLRSACCQ